jgi:glucose-1-phosphate thymidylyltransferase
MCQEISTRAENSRISEIAIALGNVYQEKVKEYYGDGKRFGVRIHYVQRDEPKGITRAIGLACARTI